MEASDFCTQLHITVTVDVGDHQAKCHGTTDPTVWAWEKFISFLKLA